MHVCVGQRSVSGVISQESLALFAQTGSLIDLGLTDQTKMAAQGSPGFCTSLPLSVVNTSAHHYTLFFLFVVGVKFRSSHLYGK